MVAVCWKLKSNSSIFTAVGRDVSMSCRAYDGCDIGKVVGTVC